MPSVISNIDCYVFDPLTTSSAFPSFSYDADGSSTGCGSLTYEVTLALGSAANMISTFTVDSIAQTF